MYRLLVSWRDYVEHLDDLVHNIKLSGKKYKAVLGIPRGGYTVAVFLSHALDLPLVGEDSPIEDTTLICEDIVDSGKTWEDLRKIGAKDIAAVFIKESTPKHLLPTYFAAITDADAWVVFPYEKGEKDV